MVRLIEPIKAIEQAQPSQCEIDAGSLLESRRPERTFLQNQPQQQQAAAAAENSISAD